MTTRDPERDASRVEAEMAAADVANGEGPADERSGAGPANDTEARYGRDESPA